MAEHNEMRRNTWIYKSSEICKMNDRKQTKDPPGSSENSKQNKHQKATSWHIIFKLLNTKKKRGDFEKRKQHTLLLEE